MDVDSSVNELLCGDVPISDELTLITGCQQGLRFFQLLLVGIGAHRHQQNQIKRGEIRIDFVINF